MGEWLNKSGNTTVDGSYRFIHNYTLFQIPGTAACTCKVSRRPIESYKISSIYLPIEFTILVNFLGCFHPPEQGTKTEDTQFGLFQLLSISKITTVRLTGCILLEQIQSATKNLMVVARLL